MPKPLIPVGDKTLIENVIQKFYDQGLKEFIVSINYKKELIKAYFRDLKLNYNIGFIEEKNFRNSRFHFLFKKTSGDNFIVTNCDTIIDLNINNLLQFQKSRKLDLTIVVNYKNYNQHMEK